MEGRRPLKYFFLFLLGGDVFLEAMSIETIQQKTKCREERITNCRISRGRRVVEYVFKIKLADLGSS